MGPRRYLIFFLMKFPSNAVRIMSGDAFLTRVMTIFIKTYICVKVELGDNHGWKERQKLCRMVFSK